jgi:hypothetical protein
LDKIQNSRMDLARSADSGFNEDADVSTAQGAIETIPLGLAYLMLAPFPWQLGSLRQTITLPEVLVWWALIPFMVSGIIFSVKHKLRTAFPILFFALTLTLAYSVFQGNVGTAYRQRTQIQVFLLCSSRSDGSCGRKNVKTGSWRSGSKRNSLMIGSM